MTNLFFISSPLHFLEACNLASERQGEENIAVIISKNAESAANFKQTIDSKLTRFAECVLLLEHNNGSKLAARKVLMKSIKALVEAKQLRAIYTGNDRRIEFQYAMSIAQEVNPSVEGIYMDDGAISYLGHKSINRVFHRYIDPLLKKLVYGSWWKNAITTGASDWISTCYLALPDHAHALLQQKNLKPIQRDTFSSEAFKEIGASLLNEHDVKPAELLNIKVLFCLPVDDEFEAKKAKLIQLYKRLCSQYTAQEIAIKAHPRSQLDKAIETYFEGSMILSKSIGFEALLPLLHDQTKIIGTTSTALLTTKWLRPEIEVSSLTSSSDARLNVLFDTLGIRSIN